MYWIPLSRSIMKAPVFECPRTLKVWIWCRLKASHRPTAVNMVLAGRAQAVPLTAGQFIFSFKNGAKEVQLPVTTFRREVAKLQEMGEITVQPRQYFSILTLKKPLTIPPKKTLTDTLKNAQQTTDRILTNDEVNNALQLLQQKQLPQMMADLFIHSHPDKVCSSYQAYLQKRPQPFTSILEIQNHLQQYLLAEWG